MQTKEPNLKAFHLAGIIPVAGQPLDFNMDWSDCLMPIAPNFTAVDLSVLECAMAGCETIWIVCNDDVSPLIRHRIGEYVLDPVSVGRMGPRPRESRRQVPVFYVPTHPNDRERRDCLGWSVLHGAQSAYHISLRISRWVTPDKYYVSFPYGVFNPDSLRPFRKNISSNQQLYLTHNENTVKNNEYLSFTFSPEDFIKIRREFRKKATNEYFDGKRLPREKRYSGRHFSLDKVFDSVILEGSMALELPWYHNIGSWDGYCEYLASPNRTMIKRPSKIIFDYKEFCPIGQK
tara:strand:- start:1503 stop:2372 length:870 start_codon:yes stop_codon:yes gene_type:complete